MKRTLIALTLANLALVGCGSDDNNETKPIDPPPPPPPATVEIGDATTIAVADVAVNEASGVVTFTLANEEGTAITGLAADTAALSLKYVGLQAPVEWNHMVDKMGLISHESQVFDCAGETCNIAIVEGETKGSYTLTPDGFEWSAEPQSVKSLISVATETVTVDPILVDSGA
ncbi:hypothetical protein [Ferrimonas sp.]|uniref:hypothetical protein n=1 Tax=Ferrimonas sp. TaxID=2080861 RepID=UPI003A92C50E